MSFRANACYMSLPSFLELFFSNFEWSVQIVEFITSEPFSDISGPSAKIEMLSYYHCKHCYISETEVCPYEFFPFTIFCYFSLQRLLLSFPTLIKHYFWKSRFIFQEFYHEFKNYHASTTFKYLNASLLLTIILFHDWLSVIHTYFHSWYCTVSHYAWVYPLLLPFMYICLSSPSIMWTGKVQQTSYIQCKP